MRAASDETPHDLAIEVARWLVDREGLAAVASVTAALDGGADELTVARRLRDDVGPPDRRAAALSAAVARRRARPRWPDADRLLFTRTALEQASDPAVSAWRARRLAGDRTVEDRGCGVGGDTLALADAGADVLAIDHDAGRLVLLEHNAGVRGVVVRTRVADALTHPVPRGGPVHADPGRRVGERRVRTLADHRPSVPALLAHLDVVVRGAGVAVALSPAVDLDDPGLPSAAELEFVQVAGDLVESVLWTGGLRNAGDQASATLLAPDGSVRAQRGRGPRGPDLPVGSIGDAVLDVAPAAVRARLHDELGAEVGARRLAQRRALLTVDGDPPVSPWWRVRPVAAVLPARPAAVRRWLATAEPRPVELVRHGLDVDLTVFRRGLGRPPGGPSGWRVELVRLDRGATAIVTDASHLPGASDSV